MVTEQKLQEFGAYAVELTRIGLGALKEYRYKELSLYAIESVEGTTYYLKEGKSELRSTITEYSNSYLAARAFCRAAWKEMMQ